MNKGIFITGTDTGVGKTYVAARIVKELISRGIDAGVMKPAETGCARRNGKLHPSDAARLVRAAGVRDNLADVNPFRFSKPLAPSIAAELDGSRIYPGKLLRAFRNLSAKHKCMVVEGAGGIMVPLSNRYSFLDLAEDFHLPVLIVARPGLGTINHTLLTTSALRARKLPIAGIVINYAERTEGTAEKTAPAVIEKISGIRIVGIVHHSSNDVKGIVDIIQPPGRQGAEM